MQSLRIAKTQNEQADWLAYHLKEEKIIDKATYDFLVNCKSEKYDKKKKEYVQGNLYATNFFYFTLVTNAFLTKLLRVQTMNTESFKRLAGMDDDAFWKKLKTYHEGPKRRAPPRPKELKAGEGSKEEEEYNYIYSLSDEEDDEEDGEEDEEQRKNRRERRKLDYQSFIASMHDKNIRRQIRELQEEAEDEEDAERAEKKTKKTKKKKRGHRATTDSDEESEEEIDHGSEPAPDPFDSPEKKERRGPALGGGGAAARGAPLPHPRGGLRPRKHVNYGETQPNEGTLTQPGRPREEPPNMDGYDFDTAMDILWGRLPQPGSPREEPPSEDEDYFDMAADFLNGSVEKTPERIPPSPAPLDSGTPPQPIYGQGAAHPTPQAPLSKERTEAPKKPFQTQDTNVNRLGLIAATPQAPTEAEAEAEVLMDDDWDLPPISSFEDFDDLFPPSARLSRMAARFSSLKM
jgi:hypothetical protein